MWGFARQTTDGMAGSASGATGGTAVGPAVDDRENLAARGLLPLRQADRGGPLFTRDVLSGAGPETTGRDSGARHSLLI
jgi:hypothetical protein